LFVDEQRRVLRAQRLTLRLREGHERLVYQHHGGYAFFPRCKCVAHGGAGARPSGTDTDDEIVDRVGDLLELRRLERGPCIGFVCALDLSGLA